MELKQGDSLEVAAHTPMYNPHILPLKEKKTICKVLKIEYIFKKSIKKWIHLYNTKVLPETDL